MNTLSDDNSLALIHCALVQLEIPVEGNDIVRKVVKAMNANCGGATACQGR